MYTEFLSHKLFISDLELPAMIWEKRLLKSWSKTTVTATLISMDWSEMRMKGKLLLVLRFIRWSLTTRLSPLKWSSECSGKSCTLETQLKPISFLAVSQISLSRQKNLKATAPKYLQLYTAPQRVLMLRSRTITCHCSTSILTSKRNSDSEQWTTGITVTTKRSWDSSQSLALLLVIACQERVQLARCYLRCMGIISSIWRPSKKRSEQD